MLVTAPAVGPDAGPPSAKAFYAAYERRYGPAAAVRDLRLRGDEPDADRDLTGERRRQSTRFCARGSCAAIFDTSDRRSVLGTYSITRTGDTTIRRYGVWRVIDGEPVVLEGDDRLMTHLLAVPNARLTLR